MGEFHCLNVGCADASIIKTQNYCFIVDCYDICSYSSLLPNNRNIKGVIITHQHEDHYKGLLYLKDNNYHIDNLIYSPYLRRYNDNSVTIDEWNEFIYLKEYFKNKGTSCYNPFRQESFDKPFWSIDGIRIIVLGPHKYIANSETREIHDACLVLGIYMGYRKCIFTGDASDTYLKQIADTTTNYCNDILHASHHGSINGADLDFIKKANIKYTIISTKSGEHPNVPHPTTLQRYRQYTKYDVRRADVDGSWRWDFKT